MALGHSEFSGSLEALLHTVRNMILSTVILIVLHSAFSYALAKWNRVSNLTNDLNTDEYSTRV